MISEEGATNECSMDILIACSPFRTPALAREVFHVKRGIRSLLSQVLGIATKFSHRDRKLRQVQQGRVQRIADGHPWTQQHAHSRSPRLSWHFR